VTGRESFRNPVVCEHASCVHERDGLSPCRNPRQVTQDGLPISTDEGGGFDVPSLQADVDTCCVVTGQQKGVGPGVVPGLQPSVPMPIARRGREMTLPDRHWRYVTVRVYDLGDVVLPFGAQPAGYPQYQYDELDKGCWLVGYWDTFNAEGGISDE
jgi:hypothetical protein